MSVALTIRSGIDVPKLLVAFADGDSVGEPVTEYDTDLRYRWLLPNGLLWAGQQERRLTGLLDFLCPSGERICYGTLSGEDPLVIVGVGYRACPPFSTGTCDGRFSTCDLRYGERCENR